MVYLSMNTTEKAAKNKEKEEVVIGLIAVHSTEEGKLYIDPTELFSRPEIQKLLEKAAKSKAFNDLKKVMVKVEA